MPDPIDYISPLGRFADAGQLMQSMQLGDAQIATERAQAQAIRDRAAQQAAEHQTEMQRRSAYQSAVAQVLTNPTDKAGYRRLLVEFPEFADSLKAAYSGLDEDQKRLDLAQATDVAALALGGNYKGAADSLRRRVEADRAAGVADPSDEQLLAELESGDPVRQKAAAGLASAHVAAIGGIQHFSGILDSLGKGSAKPDIRNVGAGDTIISIDPETGEAVKVYESPYMKGADGTIFEREGGDPDLAGGGGKFASTVHPAAASVASALSTGGLPAAVVAGFMGNFHAEGGYDGAQGDGGSASGIAQWRHERADNFRRIIGKDITKASHAEQARFVLWEMQNPQAAGMTVKQRDAILAATSPAQAAALIDQYYERSSGRDRKVRIQAANAFAGQFTPGGGGGAWKPVLPTKEAPKPVRMSPQEVAAEGLDPNTVYYRDKDGVPQAVSGQTRQDTGQLKPVPVAQAKLIGENRATIREIDRAIALIRKRPQSIGWGTGVLGDWFTQRNDPDGTPVRAAIGKIGGKIIHDISGAAVTMAEAPRFQPYVPVITDTPDTAIKKLQQLRDLAKGTASDLESLWGPDNGYRGVKFGGSPQTGKGQGWGKARRVN